MATFTFAFQSPITKCPQPSAPSIAPPWPPGANPRAVQKGFAQRRRRSSQASPNMTHQSTPLLSWRPSMDGPGWISHGTWSTEFMVATNPRFGTSSAEVQNPTIGPLLVCSRHPQPLKCLRHGKRTSLPKSRKGMVKMAGGSLHVSSMPGRL